MILWSLARVFPMGALRVDFLKLVIISYSGDTDFFMCRQKREEEEGDKGHI